MRSHRSIREWSSGTDASDLDRETVVRIYLPEHRRGPVNASSCRSSSIGRAPSCHGGGNGIETRLWRQALVVKRMITGDYGSPVPGSKSWPGCQLVVAQMDKSAALRRQRPLVRVQSTRPRRHSSVERVQPRYGSRSPDRLRGGGSGILFGVRLAPWRDWDVQRSPTPEDARSNRAGGAVGGSETFLPACIWRVHQEERCWLAKRWPRATSPAFDPLPLRPGRYASLAGAPCCRRSSNSPPDV